MMNLLPSEHSLKMRKSKKSASGQKDALSENLSSDVDWKLTGADVSSSSPSSSSSPLKSSSSLSNASYTDSELTCEHPHNNHKTCQPTTEQMQTSSSTNSASSATQEAKSIASTSCRHKSVFRFNKKKPPGSKRRYSKLKFGSSNRKNVIPRVQKHDAGEIKRKKVTKLNGRKLDAYRTAAKTADNDMSKVDQADKTTTALNPYMAGAIDYEKLINMASTSAGIGTVANPIASSSTTLTSEGPPAYLLAQILATPGTHLAKSHDDTSVGAVHCFQVSSKLFSS